MENQQQINIEELTLEQLKSLAYDLIVQINQIQNNLNTVQAQITKKTIQK